MPDRSAIRSQTHLCLALADC